jgi:hypothetical protein
MAELTVHTERDPNQLTEEELDSLRVGEELQAEQADMLAGKFRDAEELEKAYIELQQKLGQPKEEAEPEEGDAPEAQEEEDQVPDEPSEIVSLISDASTEYYQNEGQLSEETLSKLYESDSKELVAAYMQMQQNQPQQEVPDISDRDVIEIKNMAGGDEGYAQMTGWASENLPQEDVQAFDALVATGQMGAIRLAVAGLKSLYQEQVGYEGRMLSGKSAVDTQDVFRSQAEVIRAMNDPRYENDPAYRNDVFQKLDRSNMEW